MKRWLVFFSLLATSAPAQTITLGAITRVVNCVGATIFVPYTAQGTFGTGNLFKVQLSDAKGSFATFTTIGQDSKLSDTIPVVMSNTGDDFHVRVISTSPYVVSSANTLGILVSAFPDPQPSTSKPPSGGVGAVGFAGDAIQFSDRASESPGSSFFWKFNNDASIDSSNSPSPELHYLKEGVKTGTLTVTNNAGCSATSAFTIAILSCEPTIPANVRIVRGTESGSDPFVWVLSGGSFTATLELSPQIIFVEPGGSLTTSWRSNGLYYLKAGSSFIDQAGPFGQTAVFSEGFPVHRNEALDTFSCSDLQFDYSQLPDSLRPLPASVERFEARDPIVCSMIQNHLVASAEGLSISLKLWSVLGAEVQTSLGAGTLNLDLSSLPAGVYFAVVQAGDAREIKRIAVVH